MTQQEAMVEAHDASPLVRSSVKIDMNAKGLAQLKVHVYEDTTEEEMQRVKDLAIRTYQVAMMELSKITNIAQ